MPPLFASFRSLLPTRAQFRRWSYPNKYGFVLPIIGLAMGTAYWLFPDVGKHLINSMFSAPLLTVSVPGKNAIEQQINLAKMQSVVAIAPSTEFAVAIPFVHPTLPSSSEVPAEPANIIALSNASPLRSENQDIVFAPGKCRFLGSARWYDQPSMTGEVSITVLSCVLDNGDAYGIGRFDGAEIGFVAPIEQPSSRELQFIRDGKFTTFPLSGKYIVRFLSPLRDLSFTGKSVASW